MSGRMSPHGRRVRELLSDGEWHPLEEVYRVAGPVIPPGQAYRRAEYNRVRQLQQRSIPPKPRVKGTREMAINSGRRNLVYDIIYGMVRTRAAEWGLGPEDNGTYIRSTRDFQPTLEEAR